MRIFYLIDTLYKSGGMERILTCKANSLCRDYGYEVSIVTNHQKGRPVFFPLDSGVEHIDLNVNYRLPFMMPLYVRKLRALIEERKPDVVISTCGKELPIMEKLPGDCIHMAEFHFCRAMYAIKGQKRRLAPMDRAVGKLDCFVALTREDAALWSGKCKRVEQIYNPSFMDESLPQATLESKRCISAGRFEKQKNFRDLVLAWEKVHARFPDWQLDIYGDGRHKAEIEALVSARGLTGSVSLHPASRKIGEEILKSAVFVMSSIYEGFPLVMIEAASLGVPFVSYRCPCGPGEFISDGKEGYTAEPGNVDELAGSICRCIEDPALLKEMGRNIRTKADDFTVDKIMKQWDALLRDLLKQHKV